MKKLFFLFLAVLIFTGCSFLFPKEDEVFVVEVIVDPNVTVTPMRAELSKGESVVFTYTLKEGYILNSITVDGVSIVPFGNTFSISNVTSDKQVNIITTKKEEFFAVNVTADSGVIVTPMKAVVQKGENAVFTYTLKEGYVLNSITAGGVSITPSSGSFTLTNIGSDKQVNITTKEKEKPKFTISATAGLGGKVTPSGEIIVTEGQDQTFGIVSNPGFLQDILKINDVAVPSTNSYTFLNVTSNAKLDATFKKDSLLWPMLYIEWREDSVYINGGRAYIPDGDILNYYSNGTYVRTVKGVLRPPEESKLDKSTSPATIYYGGSPYKIEQINDERYVISEVNAWGQYVQLIFKNNKYKQL